jgi:hypothetical protein
MVKRRGKTGNHAEGGHGPRTHARLIDQLESGPGEVSEEERLRQARGPAEETGKQRLYEGRQQHDEAEKQSERRRLENEE